MAQISLDEERIKELFKRALLELLQEQRGLFYDVLVEVLEDWTLTNAIREGESTETVSRSEVFQLLETTA